MFACTDAIQAQVNGWGEGILLVSDGTGDFDFASSEYGSNQPILNVTYEPDEKHFDFQDCEDNGPQSGSSASKNYGGCDNRDVNGDSRRIFMQFDLSPIPGGSTVDAAVCSLYCVTCSNAGSVYVSTLTESWVEGDSCDAIHDDASSWTYRQYNELSWASAGGTYTNEEDTVYITSGGWTAFDVTDAVQAQVDGTGYGFLFRGNDSVVRVYMALSEYATWPHWRPLLIVEYSELVPIVSGSIFNGAMLEGRLLE
jgi:hypothetical protein